MNLKNATQNKAIENPEKKYKNYDDNKSLNSYYTGTSFTSSNSKPPRNIHEAPFIAAPSNNPINQNNYVPSNANKASINLDKYKYELTCDNNNNKNASFCNSKPNKPYYPLEKENLLTLKENDFSQYESIFNSKTKAISDDGTSNTLSEINKSQRTAKIEFEDAFF
jgi:hypothetical protein